MDTPESAQPKKRSWLKLMLMISGVVSPLAAVLTFSGTVEEAIKSNGWNVHLPEAIYRAHGSGEKKELKQTVGELGKKNGAQLAQIATLDGRLLASNSDKLREQHLREETQKALNVARVNEDAALKRQQNAEEQARALGVELARVNSERTKEQAARTSEQTERLKLERSLGEAVAIVDVLKRDQAKKAEMAVAVAPTNAAVPPQPDPALAKQLEQMSANFSQIKEQLATLSRPTLPPAPPASSPPVITAPAVVPPAPPSISAHAAAPSPGAPKAAVPYVPISNSPPTSSFGSGLGGTAYGTPGYIGYQTAGYQTTGYQTTGYQTAEQRQVDAMTKSLYPNGLLEHLRTAPKSAQEVLEMQAKVKTQLPPTRVPQVPGTQRAVPQASPQPTGPPQLPGTSRTTPQAPESYRPQYP